jgi:DNA-binding HxlR family transcriptional regulator
MTDRLHIPKGKYARTGYVSPIDAALEIIGGKYKVAILYYIRESVLRFGELRRLMPLATKRMLTKQLRELERDGMIDTQGLPPSAAPRRLFADEGRQKHRANPGRSL